MTLAEAEFFRIRWSQRVLDETRYALQNILAARGYEDAEVRAAKSCASMTAAFEEAMVTDYAALEQVCTGFPDPDDAHVVAAALKTQAAAIVTENLKDFPAALLAPLNLEAKSADQFIADTIALDTGRAVAAIRKMRERFKKPSMTAESLLLEMEAAGLTQVVDILRPHVLSL